MPGRRPPLRLGAWIALAAILLSIFPPAGAHALGTADRLGDHADYCSASGTAPAGPATPQPADHGLKVCTHCDGCAGHAGGSWGPPPARSSAPTVATSGDAVAVVSPTATLAADLIAAPPRGPPRAA